ATQNRPKNGSQDQADGKYNGALCVPPDGSNYTQADWEAINHCTNDLSTIRQDTMIIMACHTPLLNQHNLLPDQPTAVTLQPGVEANGDAIPPVAARPAESKTITAFLADCNGNSMPDGTEI